MPDEAESKTINRQWLCNLCNFLYLLFIGNTFNEDDFETMIYDAIKNREQKIIDKNSMEINVESRIAIVQILLNVHINLFSI